ncbi:phosphotransferase [Trueperella pecoris]|uniref:Phosphotransferase n=2 Tax=Trueperella pecoris TaxID=2733571 RepID=A0A7M1R4X9_9ACTO|nr:phosphotransferase [Trueperella pecoris]
MMENKMEMNLTEESFRLLAAMSSGQEESAAQSGLSESEHEEALGQLHARGYVREGLVTDEGMRALAPYKVDNAIIMAAGLSSRFAPISYERPKGTLRVRGEILIERQIRQLQEAGIGDITVVVGYKKEHFFYLADKFDGVSIVVNEEFATRNNNGSLWRVREKLANTYICSSDNYFVENPFEPYVYRAYYSAVYVPGQTDEWCLELDEHDRIIGCTVGGEDAWVMLGHVYVDQEFSQAFRSILERVYEKPDTVSKLWESIYIEHIDALEMHARKYPEDVIFEFDSLDELQDFDPQFIENVDSKILANICQSLDCTINDISDFYPLKEGISNLSCHFEVGGRRYIYRHPGAGTEKIVDRQSEHTALLEAKRIGLDTTFVVGEPHEGWKISRFIPNTRNLDETNKEELVRAMELVHRLHHSGIVLDREFDYITNGLEFDELLREHGEIKVPGYEELKEKVIELKRLVDQESSTLVPSHNDLYGPNFLVYGNQIDIIDWEYAGMSDVASDFATLVVCSEELPEDVMNAALAAYLGHEPSADERRHVAAYVVFAGWCWYVWALAKEAEGDDLGHWLLTYYRHAVGELDEILGDYRQISEPRERA